MLPKAIADQLVVSRGPLRVEIGLRPFSFTVRHDGRRLLRAAGLWVADGTVHDQFIQFTEGVVAREQRAPIERALHALVIRREQSSVTLSVGLYGGRTAHLGLGVCDGDQIQLELEADGDPLRLAFDWDRRSGEHLVGLGVRHNTSLDQAGRNVQLCADRRYTGPDCPPEVLAEGGSRRATARRCHGWSRAAATRSGARPTATERGSILRATGSACRRAQAAGRCGCAYCARRRRPHACAHCVA